MLIRQDEIEVRLKDPGQNLDVTIEADRSAFTKVWTGYSRLEEARARRLVKFRGDDTAIAQMHRMLKYAGGPCCGPEGRYGPQWLLTKTSCRSCVERLSGILLAPRQCHAWIGQRRRA